MQKWCLLHYIFTTNTQVGRLNTHPLICNLKLHLTGFYDVTNSTRLLPAVSEWLRNVTPRRQHSLTPGAKHAPLRAGPSKKQLTKQAISAETTAVTSCKLVRFNVGINPERVHSFSAILTMVAKYVEKYLLVCR